MKIRWQSLRGHADAPLIILDLALLLLITGNLLWLLLDAIMMNTGTGLMIARQWPDFARHYRDNLHPDLLLYDSYFTFFLISELLLRWAVAIYRKTYHRWFFYPFVHWYDVLGSIPLPAFRVLRLLRIVSILYRLQKMGVIDLTTSGPFPIVYKYYQILLEELSDRIVVNVLEGVQREVRGRLVLRREAALGDARALLDPFVAGIHIFFEIVISDNILWHIHPYTRNF